MTKKQIDAFLSTLANELALPARAYLTGAAAGALWGRVRPSLDIDLGIELRGKGRGNWMPVDAAIRRTTALTGIPTSAAADIDRWGMITLLDYKKTSHLYRRFGLLEVRLLDPIHWAIGKLTRCLEPDIRDVVEVFRKRSPPASAVARTWGRALRASPASASQFLFRSNVERFFRDQGRKVWGREFAAEATIGAFHRAARIPVAAPPRTRQ